MGGKYVLPAPGWSLHLFVETLLEPKVIFFGYVCFGLVCKVLYYPRVMVVVFYNVFQKLFDFSVCSIIYS